MWFSATAGRFKSADGVLHSRKLAQYLDTVGIFESRSQLVKFIRLVDFKRQDTKMISFLEFSYALKGCGLQNIGKLREHACSQATKPAHNRHSQKLPLHMNPNAPPPMQVMDSSSYKKDVVSRVRRTTTKTPLPGGGILYACCPDVPSCVSNLVTGRATTAPAPTAPPAPKMFALPDNNTLQFPMKIGKLVRQKTSKYDLFGGSGDAGMLPPVVHCGGSPGHQTPRRGLLQLDSDMTGRLERDYYGHPSSSSCSTRAAVSADIPDFGPRSDEVADTLKKLQDLSQSKTR